jgi:hypothetical protein
MRLKGVKEGMKMKKVTLFFLVVSIMALIPASAFAGAVEGTVQGFNCVTHGKVCPVGKEDPMVAAERVFVVLTKSGSYYFVPNLDRAILARHINQMVRVSGKASEKYPSIMADKLEVMKDGKWAETWNMAAEQEIRAAEYW